VIELLAASMLLGRLCCHDRKTKCCGGDQHGLGWSRIVLGVYPGDCAASEEGRVDSLALMVAPYRKVELTSSSDILS
jgi:hypothetical protein